MRCRIGGKKEKLFRRKSCFSKRDPVNLLYIGSALAFLPRLEGPLAPMLRGIAGRLAPVGQALLRPQPSLLPRRHLFHALSAPDAARGAAARARPAARVARKCVCSSAADVADASLVRETRFREIYDEIARGALISRNDLKLGLERAVPGCEVSNDQVDRMMRVADLDSSGHVDYSEFRFLFDDIHDDDISLSSLAETWLGFSDSVKDPTIIFNMAWRRLISAVGGERNVRLPTEIMFLGGAPGAGKGTMTPYIMWERGLEGSPVVMSSLLNSPQAKKIIDEGGLVGDMEVFTMLLDELASPSQRLGSLVDGFPRTVAQVQLLQLLHAKMSELSRTYDHTELQSYFPRPRFRMCILFVDEHVSIERQLSRGRQALEHNKSVADAGEGELLEVTHMGPLTAPLPPCPPAPLPPCPPAPPLHPHPHPLPRCATRTSR